MSALRGRALDWANRFLHADVSAQPEIVQKAQRVVSLAALNRYVGFLIPFTRRNHFKVVEVRSGYLKASVALRGNSNHFGAMYAGAMFLLAEIPGGVVTLFEFGPSYLPILKELTMRYLQPATSDLTIELSLTQAEIDEIRRKADEKGKGEFTLNLDLRDAKGVVVAQSVALYQLRVRGK